MAVSIHPAVDGGVKPGAANFAGGTLTCKCATSPVTVSLKGEHRLQPRLRLHEVLEARRRRVLAGRGHRHATT